jgi:acyl-coenzyme A thioesterase PaaI-like protein
MGASALTFVRGRKVFHANAEMKVSFLRPVPVGTTLTCTAYVLSGGNKAVFAEADVVDGNDKLVLKASSTYLLWSRDD